MRKFLLSILSVIALGASAQDPVVSIVTNPSNTAFTVGKVSGYASSFTMEDASGQSFSVYGFNNNNNGWTNIRGGNKNAATTEYSATFTTGFTIAAAVNKVSVQVVRYNNGTNDKITSIVLQSSPDGDWANSATDLATITDFTDFYALTKLATSATVTASNIVTYDLNVEAPEAGKYYRVVFNLPKSTNNGYVGLVQVDYYGEVEAGTVTAPTITLADNNMVELSQADGDPIYYTTNGDDPSAASTPYTAPFEITGLTTVKAVAIKDGKSSSITTRSLNTNTISSLGEFLDRKSTADALKINSPLTAIYQCGRNLYLTDGEQYILAYNNNNVEAVTNLGAVNGDQISTITGVYKSQNGLPEIIPSAIGEKTAGTAVEPEELALDEIGLDILNKYVKIVDVTITDNDAANTWNATDGSTTLAIYNSFYNATNYPDAITLPDGTKGNTVPTGENFTVIGFVGVYNNNLQIIPIEISGGKVIETVATPVFTPASGSKLKVGDKINITCETEGATIYFTTDDEDPTTDSQVWEGEIAFSEDVTIRAIAVKEGWNDSKVATATYTLAAEGTSEVTFDFTNATKLTSQMVAGAVEAPTATSTGVALNDVTLQDGPIAISFEKNDASTDIRWWKTTTPSLELRFYKASNGTGTNVNVYVAEDGYKIKSIVVTKGSAWGVNVSDNEGSTSAWNNTTLTYTAPADKLINFVTFNATANSYLSNIKVEYVEDENSIAGIEEIGVDSNNDAPVEYYNLQGVKVNADNLTGGIYVRRQGTTATKVLVK